MNPDDLRSRQQLNTGFVNALSRAFEFAATTAIFCGLGWVVDRIAGTAPIFLIALTLLGLVGQFVRMWYAYDNEMKGHEAEFAARNKRPAASGTATSVEVTK